MNRESDNFVAELLLKTLGARPDGRVDGAGAAVARGAGRTRVPLGGVRIVDGSGLSRLDRSRQRALVGLLNGAGLTRASATRSSPRSPWPGSAARSNAGSTARPAYGQVIAKTGTTRWRPSLSGYVRGRYVFAVLQNGEPGRDVAGARRRTASDRALALRLARGAPPAAGREVASASGGTPSFWAFELREPGLSPTTTPAVFFETEPATLAPSASSAAPACSRDQPSSVPVTYVLPVSGPSTGRSASSPRTAAPSSRSSATRRRFSSSANHSAIASARSGPIPSTS